MKSEREKQSEQKVWRQKEEYLKEEEEEGGGEGRERRLTRLLCQTEKKHIKVFEPTRFGKRWRDRKERRVSPENDRSRSQVMTALLISSFFFSFLVSLFLSSFPPCFGNRENMGKTREKEKEDQNIFCLLISFLSLFYVFSFSLLSVVTIKGRDGKNEMRMQENNEGRENQS